jgi:hypothetical protein
MDGQTLPIPSTEARLAARASLANLEAEIVDLWGHVTAATYRFLELVAELDRAEGWAGVGVASCAHWLNLNCGIGIDRVHFGIVLIVNMEIAFLTPPIGLNLFVLSNIAKAPIAETIRGVAPFVALLLGFLLIVISFPELSLWLPNAVYD